MRAQFDTLSSTWNVYPDRLFLSVIINKEETCSCRATITPTPGIIIHFANNLYCLNTKKEIVEYYHATAGWPVKKTLNTAIKCNAYASWSGLIEKHVPKHLEVREPTVMGHMNAQKSGTQSSQRLN